MSDLLHLTIAGAAYTARPVSLPDGSRGFLVGARSALTDRLHRNYTVRCRPDGVPYGCTCGDHCHRSEVSPDGEILRKTCKHMQTIAALEREQRAAEDNPPIGGSVPADELMEILEIR